MPGREVRGGDTTIPASANSQEKSPLQTQQSRSQKNLKGRVVNLR